MKACPASLRHILNCGVVKTSYFQHHRSFYVFFFSQLQFCACSFGCIDTSPSVQMKRRLRLARGKFFQEEEQFWLCVVFTQFGALAGS